MRVEDSTSVEIRSDCSVGVAARKKSRAGVGVMVGGKSEVGVGQLHPECQHPAVADVGSLPASQCQHSKSPFSNVGGAD